MEQAKNDQVSRFLRHGILNFLTGIFLIVTVLQFKGDEIDMKAAQYLSWVIGGLFIVAAFGLIVAVFPVGKGYKEKIEKLETKLLPTIYMVSMVQLGINVVLFYTDKLTLLFTITGIFLLVVLVAMIYMIKKIHVLSYIPTLMTATLIFNVFSVTLLFIEASKWQIIPYALIGIALLIRTMFRYEREHMKKNEQ